MSLAFKIEKQKRSIAYLDRGEDERVGNHYVLATGDVEDDDFGNVLRSERLHAAVNIISLLGSELKSQRSLEGELSTYA